MEKQLSAHNQRWRVYMLTSYSGTLISSGYTKHMDPIYLSVFKFQLKHTYDLFKLYKKV